MKSKHINQAFFLGTVVVGLFLIYPKQKAENLRIDFQSIKKNSENAIMMTNSQSNQEIFIIEQPGCDACKKINRELSNLTDIRVNIFLLAPHGGDQLKRAQEVYCSENKIMAIEKLGQESTEIINPCESDIPIKNFKMAKDMGITATPAIIFPSGEVIQKFQTAGEIIKTLQSR